MFARLSRSTRILQHAVRFSSDYVGPREKCFNMVQLLGRVGQQPVTRGEKGNFVTFEVATDRSYPKVDQDGKTEFVSKTEWHNICVFRPHLIEKVQKAVTKGTRLMLVGSLEYVNYEKPDGNRLQMTRIVPDDIFILSGSQT